MLFVMLASTTVVGAVMRTEHVQFWLQMKCVSILPLRQAMLTARTQLVGYVDIRDRLFCQLVGLDVEEA